MPADIRSQACSYARNGDVRVVKALGGDPPALVRARVAGRNASYFVRLNDGAWSCSCERVDCPHVAATQLVTGYDGLARKPGESR